MNSQVFRSSLVPEPALFRRVVFGFVLVCVAASLFSGCDPLGEKEDLKRRREEERAAQSHAEAQTHAMAVYLEGRIRLMKEQASALDKRRAEIQNDQQAFSRFVSKGGASKPEADGAERRKERLVALVRAPEMNALALKYLSTDFTSVSVSLVARVDEAQRAAKDYAEAVARVEALYESSVSETRDWGAASQKQRDAEIERLLREISRLESRREALRKNTGGQGKRSLVGGAHLERERAEAKSVNAVRIYELDDEIDKRRKQVDYLRSPETRQQMRYRSESQAHTGRRDAAQLKRNALWDIDRRLKPKTSVSEVLAACERETIDALREAMQGALRELEGDIRACDADLRQLKAYALAVPVSTVSELRDLKVKADALVERKRR